MENTEKKSLFKNWLIKRLLSSETTREEALNYITSNNENTNIGGGRRIRTFVLIRGQIYSLLPLTTRPSLL